MSASIDDDLTVVIAGAGPVGLTAALALARAGVRVRVLEMRDRPNQASRASTFHPPTLAILDRLGIFASMRDRAQAVRRAQYRTPGTILGELDYALLEGTCEQPLRMHFEQTQLTALLLDALASQPSAELRFNSELQSARDEGDRVRIETLEGGRRIALRARWLMGCDGAHSRVRASAGIPFEGQDYPGMALRVRTDRGIEPLLPSLAPLTYLIDDPRSASFLRMPDCWRVILRVPAGVSAEQCMAEPWILDRLAPLIPGLDHLPKVLGMDCYGAGCYSAARLRSGNILLAGDSAHLTNTRGGMNMNCGIHDAWTFADAIAGICRGADEGILDQAVSRRQTVIRDKLLPRTNTMVAHQSVWMARIQRMLADPRAARAYLSEASMLDMVTVEPLYLS